MVVAATTTPTPGPGTDGEQGAEASPPWRARRAAPEQPLRDASRTRRSGQRQRSRGQAGHPLRSSASEPARLRGRRPLTARTPLLVLARRLVRTNESPASNEADLISSADLRFGPSAEVATPLRS